MLTREFADQDLLDADVAQRPFEFRDLRRTKHDDRWNPRRGDQLAQPLQANCQVLWKLDHQHVGGRRERECGDFVPGAATANANRFISELPLQLRLPARPSFKHRNRPHQVGHDRLP